jgi:release factor glutamine methyltransferase
MDLLVTPDVLIPRPETEHVIERVLELIRSRPTLSDASSHEPRIVDVGTGSGCIALALAKELPNAEIDATDISPAALEIAKANAARHNLLDRIRFHETDLLSGIENKAFDFVVANPPYVGTMEEDQVQLEVRKFEPRVAVFAGETGLEVISRLVSQAYRVLKPGGWLVMEISGTIVEQAKAAVAEWQNIQVLPDLQTIPRVLSAQKCPEVH